MSATSKAPKWSAARQSILFTAATKVEPILGTPIKTKTLGITDRAGSAPNQRSNRGVRFAADIRPAVTGPDTRRRGRRLPPATVVTGTRRCRAYRRAKTSILLGVITCARLSKRGGRYANFSDRR